MLAGIIALRSNFEVHNLLTEVLYLTSKTPVNLRSDSLALGLLENIYGLVEIGLF